MTQPLDSLAAPRSQATAAGEESLQRATRVGVQTWDAPPERVLPLLTPQGETAWAVGWTPDIRWQAPGSGQGTLFVTHGPGAEETVWVLTTFDAVQGRVGYTRVLPGVLLVELSIHLAPLPQGRTRGEVCYRYTALSQRGNTRVLEMSEAHFASFMQDWQRELNHFLQTGRKLGAPQP